MNYYYLSGGQQVGPLSENDFEQLIQAGQILPETMIWGEGMANWQPLREVRTAAPARQFLRCRLSATSDRRLT